MTTNSLRAPRLRTTSHWVLFRDALTQKAASSLPRSNQEERGLGQVQIRVKKNKKFEKKASSVLKDKASFLKEKKSHYMYINPFIDIHHKISPSHPFPFGLFPASESVQTITTASSTSL